MTSSTDTDAFRPGVYTTEVVVDAVQLSAGTDWSDIAEWCFGEISETTPGPGVRHGEKILSFRNAKGLNDIAGIGDWLVRGSTGAFSAVLPDQFARTYQRRDVRELQAPLVAGAPMVPTGGPVHALAPVPAPLLGPWALRDQDPWLLTVEEHRAMDLMAQLWDTVCELVPAGSARDTDLGELAVHVHAAQRTILAQAAARAYPERYRLLGNAAPAGQQ